MTKPIVPTSAQYLRSHAIRGGMDLLMFAHKSHLNRADESLAAQGLGRAHHRALYILSRQPGGSVTDLFVILGITKQSLSRVLRELTGKGLLEARVDAQDRRRKMLYLTDKGAALEHDLFDQLHANMARAYAAAGETAVVGYWTLMQHLMDETAHRHFLAFNEAAGSGRR